MEGWHLASLGALLSSGSEPQRRRLRASRDSGGPGLCRKSLSGSAAWRTVGAVGRGILRAPRGWRGKHDPVKFPSPGVKPLELGCIYSTEFLSKGTTQPAPGRDGSKLARVRKSSEFSIIYRIKLNLQDSLRIFPYIQKNVPFFTTITNGAWNSTNINAY